MEHSDRRKFKDTNERMKHEIILLLDQLTLRVKWQEYVA